MALDRDDQPVVRFNTLHSSVLAAGGLLQAGAKPLDRLVMEAVDPDLVLAGRSAKLGCRVDVDGVSEVTATERADLVALQVLHQRSTHRDVDDLLATADPEHGDLSFPGLAEHRQLRLVYLGFGVSKLLFPPLSIKGRIDIPPACQPTPVNAAHAPRTSTQ